MAQSDKHGTLDLRSGLNLSLVDGLHTELHAGFFK